MAVLTMATLGRPVNDSAYTWHDMMKLRLQQNEPIKVNVINVDRDIHQIKQGDSLTVKKIVTDWFAVCRSDISENFDDERTGGSFSKETILHAKTPVNFQLFPRYGMDHCFRSAKEIMEALPAVSTLIFSVDELELPAGNHVKAKERFEIVDLVRNSSTGSRMLLLQSVKTGKEVTLHEEMKGSFFQLGCKCYKCGPHGISASELLSHWIAHQTPYVVKYLSSTPEETPVPGDFEKRVTGWKFDKKKHRKNVNTTGEDSSLPKVQDGFPDHLKERKLFFRPFRSALVRNITTGDNDICLNENAELTVRIVTLTRRKSSPSPRHRSFNNAGTSLRPRRPSLQLKRIIENGNWENAILLVTGGKIATTIRELRSIQPGHRVSILELSSTTKAVMVDERSQMYLVGMSYNGTFKCVEFDDSYNREYRLTTQDVFTMSPPFTVQVIEEDRSLGYDQLFKRRSLKVIYFITEVTAYVKVFGNDQEEISHQPFEIPISRDLLQVEIENRSPRHMSRFSTESTKGTRVSKLPVVEMVTMDMVEAIRDQRTSTRENLVFNFTNLSQFEKLGYDDEVTLSGDIYSQSGQMNSPSVLNVPPPRPPKSPDLRRKEYAWQELERRDMQDIQELSLYPRRPPKPDRFKSPQRLVNFNNNNDISSDDDLINITAVRSTSFENLHKSFDPRNFTGQSKGNANTDGFDSNYSSSYEQLIHADSSTVHKIESATYEDPRLALQQKPSHSKSKKGVSIANPNYEDNIQAITNSRYTFSRAHDPTSIIGLEEISVSSSKTSDRHEGNFVGDVANPNYEDKIKPITNSFPNDAQVGHTATTDPREESDEASKANVLQEGYEFAGEVSARWQNAKSPLTDNNLDYENLDEVRFVESPEGAKSSLDQEDYEALEYEDMRQ